MIGIYKITSPTGKIYIGQSKNIGQRLKDYKAVRNKAQIRLFNSFIKHGVESHKFEILEICLKNDLNKKERQWQDFYEVLGKNGLNCILTQTDLKPYVMSEETRLKRSRMQKGKIVTESARKNMSIAMKKRKLTEEQLNAGTKRLIEANKRRAGRVVSEITRNKIRLINTGKKYPERTGFNHHNSKIVLCLNTGVFYGSAKLASVAYGISYHVLKNRLSGRIKNNTNLIYV